MTSITWAGPRCVQEAAAILGSQNPTQGRCETETLLHTGCCKTSVKLWKHITETLYGVFFVFLGSFDCQIWAIFHFGTLWA